jgi:nucleotide-binding universal stress UspA family protein
MAAMKTAVLLVLLAGPLAGQTSLSVYSDGRVVVRRTLPQALDKGRNSLTLALDETDLATLFSPDTSVTVVSAVLRPATERSAALELAAGQTLAFARGKGDTVRATVVRATPPQYRLPDGRLLLVEPGEPLFPSELVRTAPQASLVLDATRARPTTELAYVTEGAHARPAPSIRQCSDRTRVCFRIRHGFVPAHARRSASVQLVAGAIGRARTPPRPGSIRAGLQDDQTTLMCR